MSPGLSAVARWPGSIDRAGLAGVDHPDDIYAAAGTGSVGVAHAAGLGPFHGRIAQVVWRSARTFRPSSSCCSTGGHFLEYVGIEISIRQRIQLLSSVAETLAFLHAHSIAVGDFSCKNILFSLRPTPSCFFIDCDSTSAGRRAVPFRPGRHPNGNCPRGEQLGTPAADVYKFCPSASCGCTLAPSIIATRAGCRDSTWGPLRQSGGARSSAGPASGLAHSSLTGPARSSALAAAASTVFPGPSRFPSGARSGRARLRESVGPAGPRECRVVAPATTHRADPEIRASNRNDSVPASVPGRPSTSSSSLLRRLLVRRPANPSQSCKLVVMLFGLVGRRVWPSFGLAIVAGINPRSHEFSRRVRPLCRLRGARLRGLRLGDHRA